MSISLRNKLSMPIVGLGTWKLQNADEVVYTAIKNGYRLIDAACDYGNEKEVGKGIKRAIDEGIVKREDLFVTSKLWCTYMRKDKVEPACKKTLEDLGLDYLDLYLIHFPISLKFVPFEERYPPEWFHDPKDPNPKMVEDLVPYNETWHAMEHLVDAGLTKSIGCCNIGTVMLRDVLSYCRIPPAVLQVELHPENAQHKLLRFCKERDIAVTAFSSFGATSYVELGADGSNLLLDRPLIVDIAKAHSKTPAQVLLRWAVQRGTAIIPKSSSESRLKENADVFEWDLTEDEMKEIDSLDKGARVNDPGDFCEAAFNTFYPIYE